MKRLVWRFGGLAVVLILAVSSCCGSGRNCQVIPAQVDLVKERREAAIKVLENEAKRVDRMRSSLERAMKRYDDLKVEKALLDSLMEK